MDNKSEVGLKLLFLIARSPFDDYLGGAENFVKSVSERLSKRHEVHVLTGKVSRELPDDEIINNVNLHRYSFLNIPKLRFFTEQKSMYNNTLRISKKHGIDAIVPCIIYPTGYVGVRAAKKLGISSLLSIQNKIFPRDLEGYSGRKARFALENATKIHAISHFIKRNILEFVDRGSDIEVIYDGVDTGFFDVKKVKSTGLKKKYQGTPLILCVSHFKFPQKRQDIVVQAVDKLKEEYPGIKLILVGKGNWDHVKKLVDGLGIGMHVSSLGYQPPEVVRELMSMADLFAFPTEFEGMGIVAVEALAMGLPIVATKTGPLPELIRDGKDGRLVPLNGAEMAKAIKETLESKKIARMRHERRDRARNFSWDKAAESIEKELNEMINSSA